MKACAIVAEGPDDLAAIRALLTRAGGACNGSIHTPTPLRVTLGGATIPVYAARGKKKELPQRVLDAAEGTAQLRPEVVVVCFDPDGDTAEREFAFFCEYFEEQRGTRAGALQADGTFQIGERVVQVVAAPWRHEGPAAYDCLPDLQNLERVLLTGVLRALHADPRSHWARDGIASLVAIAKDHGWKRAFRVWHAALRPTEGFVDGLLQDAVTKEHCLAALRESTAWRVIHARLAE